MQRIARTAGLAGVYLMLAGCVSQPTRTALGPPPPPFLSTRQQAPTAPIPVERPKPRPEAPVVRRGGIGPEDVQVPGGIRRGLWTHIVVHHSATDVASPQGMDDYHRNVRHWSGGLGYHFVIGNGVNYPDGALYVGHRWTRQMTGAHCKSNAGRYLGVWRPDNYFNDHGIGICLIGNFDQHRPTAKQLKTLEELICVLTEEADIDPSQVFGHGEVTHRTACPGRNLSMPTLRRQVLAALRRHGGTTSAGSFSTDRR